MPIRSVDPTAYSRVASYRSRFAATRPGKWLVRKISRWIDPLMRLTRGRLAKAVASPGILFTHTGAERECLWELAKLFMASYAYYERTAGGRRIRVLAFLPVSR